MIFRWKISMVLLLIFCSACSARSGEDALVEQALESMERATAFFRTISSRGGYGGKYNADTHTRTGEKLHNILKSSEIWIQPPGTPSVGLAYLRAYRITRDDRYLAAARDTGRALAWTQRAAGGWHHQGDVSNLRANSIMPLRKSGRCTLDDRTSQGPVDFLMNLDEYIDEPWLTASVQAGMDYIVEAQFSNGAWSQQYPLRGGYFDYYTFNDGTINDCIRVMLTAHRLYGKEQYFNSAKLGGDFIILSQQPGFQAGWAQQYDHNLKPVKARTFEPPGICSQVTGNNIQTLTDLYLYTKNQKYLAVIPKAIAWLKKSKIGPNKWSRLYEVGSNRPIYGDRDGKIHYSLSEISKERQAGYGWQGNFKIEKAVTYYEQVKRLGRDRYIAWKFTPPSRQQLAQKAQNARRVISALDKNGRWVSGKQIQTVDFVKNINILCGYLELNGPRGRDELLYEYCSWLADKKVGETFAYTRRGMYPFEELERAWNGEYTLPIGEPTTEQYLQNGCRLRDYTNAKIAVNPTKVSRKVIIDQKKSWLNWSKKKAVRELILAPYSGAILLRTPY